MKKWIAALFGLPVFCLEAQTTVNSFDDIRYWVGTGPNTSALVVQWNDGLNPVSMAWGYRWDGEANGVDMLLAVAGTTIIREPEGGDVIEVLTGADSALEITVERYGWGDAIVAIVYQGMAQMRTQADWGSGYWEYSIFAGEVDYSTWNGSSFDGPFTYSASGSSAYDQVAWWSSQVGAADRLLVNGSWDSYSFAPGSIPQSVQQPVAAQLPVPLAVCQMDQGKPSVSTLSRPDFFYQLEYSDHPAGPWNPMGDPEPGTGGEILFVDETADLPPQRFYRIALTQTL
jgi:hypothetical protein